MSEPLKPSPALLCKIGSLAVHADELTEPGGHAFDREAIRALVADAEVREWIKAMGPMLPLKRSAP